MRRSRIYARPVISLLSSGSPTENVTPFFNKFLDMKNISIKNTSDDALDNAYSPIFNAGFESTACIDQAGSILHFLRLKNDDNSSNQLSLLAITDSGNDCNDDSMDLQFSIQHARDSIAQNLETSSKSALKLLGMTKFHKEIYPHNLTSLDQGMPILVLPKENTAERKNADKDSSSIREIVLPFNVESRYKENMTLQQKLSSSGMYRPTVGLYQWPTGFPILRPLPAAETDLTLPNPSLIFQCTSLDRMQEKISDEVAMSKVGFNSLSSSGQLIIHHPAIEGIEIRLCESTELSSSFAEAQDSLMAGSLDDLQNVNVLAEGGAGKTKSMDVELYSSKSSQGTQNMSKERGKVDAMNGLGDCWVEFIANMKRPVGFFDKKARAKPAQTIAKPPDLPYE